MKYVKIMYIFLKDKIRFVRWKLWLEVVNKRCRSLFDDLDNLYLQV